MIPSNTDINQFVDCLARARVGPHVCNPYAAGTDEANAVRRANLRHYLCRMARRGPDLILIGEAPGYRGCRLTGVPFTSEALFLDGRADDFFGPDHGFRTTNEFDGIRGEATATIVWEVLSRLPRLPLLWNAFPFHPFRAGDPFSNRAPTVAELAVGRHFLEAMLALFDFPSTVAIGKKAAAALSELGVAHVELRHPSHGGKVPFTEGMEAVAQGYL